MAADHSERAHDASDPLETDEPRTPLWLTLLGAGLLTVAVVFAAVSSSSDDDPAAPTPDENGAAPAQPAD